MFKWTWWILGSAVTTCICLPPQEGLEIKLLYIAIDLLPAVNRLPCKLLCLKALICYHKAKLWRSAIKLPVWNGKWWGRLPKARPGHTRTKTAAGFAGFCTDDSHIVSCACEWVMTTGRNSGFAHHPHGPGSHFRVFYADAAVLFIHKTVVVQFLAFEFALM